LIEGEGWRKGGGYLNWYPVGEPPLFPELFSEVVAMAVIATEI